ncbi:MAG: hypothetical protein OMM_13271, partial [Candidatus Magnetoglobus multicellularis str. Araruama]
GAFMIFDGHMNLSVMDYFFTEGDMAVEFRTRPVDTRNLDGDGVIEDMEVMTIGASDLFAFAGVNGPQDSEGAIGFALSNVNIGMAFMQSPTRDTKYLSLKAMVGDASFIGVDDLTLSASNLFVAINKSFGSDDVVHFAEAPFMINAGLGGMIPLDYHFSMGQVLRTEGDITIQIGDSVYMDGHIAFETRAQEMFISDGSQVQTNMMLFTAGDLSMFFGANGPADQDEAFGFSLANTNMALMIMKPTDTEDNRSWTALNAVSDGIGFVGPDNLNISADNLMIRMNMAENTEDVLDFSKHIFEIPVSQDASMRFDFHGANGEFIEARGDLNVSIGNNIEISGAFAFEQYIRAIKLSDQSIIETNFFGFSAMGVNAFAGIRGNDPSEDIGFTLSDVSLALALMKPTDSEDTRNWTSLKAHAGEAGFVGSDIFNLTASEMDIFLNQVNEGDVVAH